MKSTRRPRLAVSRGVGVHESWSVEGDVAIVLADPRRDHRGAGAHVERRRPEGGVARIDEPIALQPEAAVDLLGDGLAHHRRRRPDAGAELVAAAPPLLVVGRVAANQPDVRVGQGDRVGRVQPRQRAGADLVAGVEERVLVDLDLRSVEIGVVVGVLVVAALVVVAHRHRRRQLVGPHRVHLAVGQAAAGRVEQIQLVVELAVARVLRAVVLVERRQLVPVGDLRCDLRERLVALQVSCRTARSRAPGRRCWRRSAASG